jgi:hypothetical protein
MNKKGKTILRFQKRHTRESGYPEDTFVVDSRSKIAGMTL